MPADASTVREFISFLERDTVEVRAWRGGGFLHAKAYVLDSSVGVGSANFTAGGLTHNRELVMWRQDDAVVRELRDWFERYWDDPTSVDYKPDLIEALRATRFGGSEYSPYELLIRTLAERYGLERPPALEEATFQLRWFQVDAVYRLIKLLGAPARGVSLADAVGLGKTYMALGVIYHFLHEKRVGKGAASHSDRPSVPSPYVAGGSRQISTRLGRRDGEYATVSRRASTSRPTPEPISS